MVGCRFLRSILRPIGLVLSLARLFDDCQREPSKRAEKQGDSPPGGMPLASWATALEAVCAPIRAASSSPEMPLSSKSWRRTSWEEFGPNAAGRRPSGAGVLLSFLPTTCG